MPENTSAKTNIGPLLGQPQRKPQNWQGVVELAGSRRTSCNIDNCKSCETLDVDELNCVLQIMKLLICSSDYCVLRRADPGFFDLSLDQNTSISNINHVFYIFSSGIVQSTAQNVFFVV